MLQVMPDKISFSAMFEKKVVTNCTHSFIREIYIPPLQGYDSEVSPTRAQLEMMPVRLVVLTKTC